MMNPATSITLCTVRLSCTNGPISGTGTGFFYLFKFSVKRFEDKADVEIPMIVTNKHVVANMTSMETTISLMPRCAKLDDAAVGMSDTHHTFRLDNLQQTIAYHPDPHVDVCAIPAGLFFQQIPADRQVRHVFVERNWHLSEQELGYTRPIEPIVMIGYPTGLWNETDNRPITRRGLTASHPVQRWNRERKFLIDAACFPGSSGSPVFLFEDGMYRTAANRYSAGTRARFIGILFAGPVFNQQGRFEQRQIPTAVGTVPVVDAMMNLGYVAHADTVDDLIPIIKNRVEAELAGAPDYSQRR
ncbi:trypsin-like peptidase domain-containing protein [Caballeronia novacaledonica]|uniref:Trypsin-like peptidase domain-containing protein n=1 Tax=Caballeronia novacaledonica TaxID=1544861 RepID=A0ACB5QJR3_9BURK|nr:trypsin-like peptidase domain-containing protein [Caballeronia novacaledonica]